MIRSLIILFNLVVAIFVKLVTGNPTAQVKAPSTAKPGEPFTVEVVIQTNGEDAFLRYAMALPEGWKAEAVETAGSTFTFDKQNVKFLWSRVGNVPELKISFKVTPAADANGDVELTHKISHTVDNLPANIILDPLKVKIEGASSSVAANNNQQSGNNNVDTTAKPPVGVQVERAVPQDEVAGTFVVSVTIFKDDLTGFGKFEDSLPLGYTATPVQTDGADFKFEHNKAKFSWWNLPKKNTLSIKYNVTVDPAHGSSMSIDGLFSYVENSFGKIYHVPVSIVKIKSDEVIAANTQNNTNTDNQSNSNNSNNNTQQNSNTSDVRTDNSQNVANNNNTQNSNSNNQSNSQQNTQVNANSSAASVSYRVQIAAMQRNVAVSYWAGVYNISETINLEDHMGLHKYTVGSFTTYSDARNHRQDVRAKGATGAFVTAYNGGTRITVQEALMISSQKWIP